MDAHDDTVRKEPTPRVEAGEEGKAHDGLPIPREEMVEDVSIGAAPEALARFAQASAARDALLAQVAGAPQQVRPHRPEMMTRGDIKPGEWSQLQWLYQRIQGMVEKSKALSTLVYSLHVLLGDLAVHGYVNTNHALNRVRAARGYTGDVTASFDSAVATVWSIAGLSGFEAAAEAGMRQAAVDMDESPKSTP